MSTPYERAIENLPAITTFLILGGGFVALFAKISWFWMIWVLGFSVLLPLVAILSEEIYLGGEQSVSAGSSPTEATTQPNAETDTTTQDALDTLRERYARGDLTEQQFERKLTRLLETETPETAVEWHEKQRETETEP